MNGLQAALRELEQDFVLDEELGRGGMGVVFRVTERETHRALALKLILSPKPEGEVVARFAREGELTARLRHPNVVRIHRRGLAAGLPWLAYELVEGARPLSAVMDELDFAGRVALVRDAASALGEAHAQGIVHRDVKADNLLVDQAGRVRVTDFGVAAACDLERLTETGAMVGTPTHVAPEQLRGAPPDPRFDVWALGVVLYRGLTGQLPFDGKNLLELVALIDRGEAPPLRTIDRSIPVDLEAVCLQALSKEPGERYRDANELAADLDRWLGGGPVSARPRRRWRRLVLPLAWAAPPLLAIGLLVAVGLRSGESDLRDRNATKTQAAVAPETPSAGAGATPTPTTTTGTAKTESPPPALASLPLPDGHHRLVRDVSRRARRGEARAMLELGRMYWKGHRGVGKHLAAAEAWYMAAGRAGNGKGHLRLGEVRLERGNREGAHAAWRAAIASGPPAADEAALLEAELAWKGNQRVEAIEWLGVVLHHGGGGRAERRIGEWFGKRRWSELQAFAARLSARPGAGLVCAAMAQHCARASWEQAAAARRARVAWLRRGVQAGSVSCALDLAGLSNSRTDRLAAASLARMRAAEGDAEAAYALAELTFKGRGVDRNPAIAMQLLERAAAKYAPAARRLGQRWRDGKGVKADLMIAARWLRRAADAGDEEATRNLIALLAAGRVPAAGQGEARKWLTALADSGEKWAKKALPRKPPGETLRLLAKAAEGGEAGARLSAAEGFLKRAAHRDVLRAVAILRADASGPSWLRLVEVFRRDLRDSSQERFLLDAAARAGSAEACGRLAESILRRSRRLADGKRATALLWRAHAGGWKPALARLGAVLESGGPGLAPDAAGAATVYEQGVGRGDLDCMVALGRLLVKGRGVPADPVRAARLFFVVAKRGDPRGHVWLGRLYGGLGPKEDPKLAERHLRKGAQAGGSAALFALGRWLIGQGRTREGLRRVRQSADRGSDPARAFLRERAGESP